MEPIFIFGCSDHARVVMDIVELEGRYTICGLLDTFVPRGTRIRSYEVLGTENDLPELAAVHRVNKAIVGIGDNWIRRKITGALRQRMPRLEFATAVHPSAYLSRDANPGPGTIVMGKVFVGIETTIQEGAVLSSKSSFEHDSTMSPFSSLGAGVTCGGHVQLGLCSALCIGVTVAHKIHIGDFSVVGAGSTVVKDIPGQVVAYGTPARVVRERTPCEPYL